MVWSLVRGIVLLPGMVLGVIPFIIVRCASDTRFAGSVASPRHAICWLAIGVAGLALVLIVRTVTLFFSVGKGTPAPWNPPKKLVVEGPYRYVRNPMINGVLCFLLAEALFFQSWPIVAWMFFFFAGNSIYFPLFEEKRLLQRFGEDYAVYCQNVPRWIPRFKPWRQDTTGRSKTE